MPRPEIFGMAAARKKRARKPWTPQRTIFNTFIAFICLLRSFTSVFSGIFSSHSWVRPDVMSSPFLHHSRRLTSLRPILLPRRRYRSSQTRGQEGDQSPNRPLHVGEV